MKWGSLLRGLIKCLIIIQRRASVYARELQQPTFIPAPHAHAAPLLALCLEAHLFRDELLVTSTTNSSPVFGAFEDVETTNQAAMFHMWSHVWPSDRGSSSAEKKNEQPLQTDISRLSSGFTVHQCKSAAVKYLMEPFFLFFFINLRPCRWICILHFGLREANVQRRHTAAYTSRSDATAQSRSVENQPPITGQTAMCGDTITQRLIA